MSRLVFSFRSRLTWLAVAAIPGALICSTLNSRPAGAAGTSASNGLIAFDQVQGSTLVVRPSGKGRRLLARHAIEPTFTPDGHEIAFSAPNGLAIMNVDGSHRHSVPNTDFGHAGISPSEYPSFSPDGSQIVFDERLSDRLYVINRDGSNLHKLSPHMAFWGVFTRDGRRIVFDDGRLDEIASIGLDGKNEHRVPGTNSRDTCPCSFSPNGKRLVFAHAGRSSGEAIFMVKSNGTGRHRLSHPPRNRIDVDPAFSPDGKLIAFNRTGFGEGDIVVMHSNGTHVRTLAAHTPGYGDPAWQPVR